MNVAAKLVAATPELAMVQNRFTIWVLLIGADGKIYPGVPAESPMLISPGLLIVLNVMDTGV